MTWRRIDNESPNSAAAPAPSNVCGSRFIAIQSLKRMRCSSRSQRTLCAYAQSSLTGNSPVAPESANIASWIAITSRPAWRAMSAATTGPLVRSGAGFSAMESAEDPQPVRDVVAEREHDRRCYLRGPDADAAGEEQPKHRRVRRRLNAEDDHEAAASRCQAM